MTSNFLHVMRKVGISLLLGYSFVFPLMVGLQNLEASASIYYAITAVHLIFSIGGIYLLLTFIQEVNQGDE